MTKPEFEIPSERLPRGFADRVGTRSRPPAPTRPAATIVLVRPGSRAPEVLLLRRNRTVGFVPGAYVFPGGRVDASDASQRAADRLDGITPASAARRLGLATDQAAAVAYYVAALREAFEETGILVARRRDGTRVPSPDEDADIAAALDDLQAGTRPFPRLLDDLDLRLDGGAVEYIAHWITPEAEPRRYDTRFFAAAVGPNARARPDGSEIMEARWLTPADALEQHRQGRLPMVFPTIKTLEAFRPFADVTSLLESFRRLEIPAILPRLVKTPTGVGIELPPADAAGD